MICECFLTSGVLGDRDGSLEEREETSKMERS